MLKNEKTLKDDVVILKAKLAVVTEDVVAQSKKFSDEDHQREYKKHEAKSEELKKSISNMKQVYSFFFFTIVSVIFFEKQLGHQNNVHITTY